MDRAEKLRVVLTAEGLADEALSALPREEGYMRPSWRNGGPPLQRRLARPPLVGCRGRHLAQRIVHLERELRRNDAAFAKTAALLVLKKAQAILAAYSGQSGQAIRFNPARHSGPKRPPVPAHFGHAKRRVLV